MFRKMIGAAFIAVALFGSPAFAGCDQLPSVGLTDSALIDLKKKCIELRQQVPSISAANIEEYADLGKKYGVALSEVAKSVGTTVNDLAQTPVGIFMLVIVGWKTIGHDLLGVIGGTFWFMTMLPLWVYIFHRLVIKDREIDETFDTSTNKLVRTIAPIKYGDGPGSAAGVLFFSLLLICAAGFFMIF